MNSLRKWHIKAWHKKLFIQRAQTIFIPVDLAQAPQRHVLVPTVLKRVDSIDILANNLGLETEDAFLRQELGTMSIGRGESEVA